jgi:hypothetical protein
MYGKRLDVIQRKLEALRKEHARIRVLQDEALREAFHAGNPLTAVDLYARAEGKIKIAEGFALEVRRANQIASEIESED